MNKFMEKQISLLSKKIPDIILIIFATVFYFLMVKGTSESLLGSSGLDLSALWLFILISLYRNGLSGISSLAMVVSYSIHLYSAQFYGGFSYFLSISWLAVCCLLISKLQWIDYIIIYHFGISFDCSMNRATGLGMQTSLYCGEQVALITGAVFNDIFVLKLRFKYDLRLITLFFAALFLFNNHCLAIEASSTAEFLMMFLSLSVFFSFRRESGLIGMSTALLCGCLIVATASILDSLIISDSLGEMFSRRAFSGNMHPNRLAAGLLAALCLISLIYKKVSSWQKTFLYSVAGICTFSMVLTGARIILAVTFLFFGIAIFVAKDFRAGKTAGFFLTIFFSLACIRFLQHFEIAEFLKNERIMIWISALKNIAHRPLTGYGVNSFSYIPQYVSPEKAFYLYDWNYPHTHSGIIEMLLWGGVPFLAVSFFLVYLLFRKNQDKQLWLVLPALGATTVFDFAWGCASLITIACFYLFIDVSKLKVVRRQDIPVPIKIAVALILIMAYFSVLKFQAGRKIFSLAESGFQRQNADWINYADIGVKALQKDPSPALRRILWQISAGMPLQNAYSQAVYLTERFPYYYVCWYMRGRLAELMHDFEDASSSHRQSLKLEPRDLTGIRNARLAIASLRKNTGLIIDSELLACLLRDSLGLPMLLNHPDFGNALKERLIKIADRYLTNSQLPDINRLHGVRNAIEWGIELNYENILRRMKSDLPDWAEDELAAAVTGFEKIESIANLDKMIQMATGSAVLRKIMIKAQSNGFDSLVDKAYKKLQSLYNYRNKNHDDLRARFIAAKSYLKTGAIEKALRELDFVWAYDQTNPFIECLYAEANLLKGKCDEAIRFYNKALNYIKVARNLPYYAERPNDYIWPEGDHWTLVIELTLRKRDPESFFYCRPQWDEFEKSIKKRLESLIK